MFGIVFNNTHLLHQFMPKLKKKKIVKLYRNPVFPHEFILINSLSHKESLSLEEKTFSLSTEL